MYCLFWFLGLRFRDIPVLSVFATHNTCIYMSLLLTINLNTAQISSYTCEHCIVVVNTTGIHVHVHKAQHDRHSQKVLVQNHITLSKKLRRKWRPTCRSRSYPNYNIINTCTQVIKFKLILYLRHHCFTGTWFAIREKTILFMRPKTMSISRPAIGCQTRKPHCHCEPFFWISPTSRDLSRIFFAFLVVINDSWCYTPQPIFFLTENIPPDCKSFWRAQ